MQFEEQMKWWTRDIKPETDRTAHFLEHNEERDEEYMKEYVPKDKLDPDKSGQHCEKDILSDIQPNPQKIGWSSVYIMLTTTVLIMYVHALVTYI